MEGAWMRKVAAYAEEVGLSKDMIEELDRKEIVSCVEE